MFKRIFYENWYSIVPIIAFLLTFAVFLCYVFRALRMRRPEIERLSRLPLEDSHSE